METAKCNKVDLITKILESKAADFYFAYVGYVGSEESPFYREVAQQIFNELNEKPSLSPNASKDFGYYEYEEGELKDVK